jgi:hypothetical protein
MSCEAAGVSRRYRTTTAIETLTAGSAALRAVTTAEPARCAEIIATDVDPLTPREMTPATAGSLLPHTASVIVLQPGCA